jgi:hypothetical protein
MPVKLISAVLTQPLLWCFLIWTKIQKFSFYIYQGYVIRGSINSEMVGQLAGWIVLGVGVLMVIGLAIKFVVEGSDKKIAAVAGNILWRLFVVLILYVIVSALLYGFAGFAQMVLKEMDFVPRGR